MENRKQKPSFIAKLPVKERDNEAHMEKNLTETRGKRGSGVTKKATKKGKGPLISIFAIDR